ncbi:MAG: class I SAM-dependent rRNA methyltransferase, partial [Phycisphaerae bacterium]
LAAGLVAPGGMMVTCSCSGAFPADEFRDMALASARHAGRKCQLLGTSGPGMDHPVHPLCPESAYLKVAWLRMLD